MPLVRSTINVDVRGVSWLNRNIHYIFFYSCPLDVLSSVVSTPCAHAFLDGARSSWIWDVIIAFKSKGLESFYYKYIFNYIKGWIISLYYVFIFFWVLIFLFLRWHCNFGWLKRFNGSRLRLLRFMDWLAYHGVSNSLWFFIGPYPIRGLRRKPCWS